MRRAWRALTRAAERNDRTAVAAMREAWLRNPRDDTWQDVSRWYPLPEVLAAAVDPHRSAESRAALGAFCLRRDLVPDNDVARALFFVLTGHHERYEALDPDGALLAACYRGASAETRKTLRHTVLGLGAVNLVRVIAERPDRPLTEDEAEYVVARLAGAGDWDELWRLVPTIPIAAAVRAARLFGDWRPADDLGQAFLARLAAADPEVAAAVSAAAVTRIDVRHPWRFSFAPDGSELAVQHTDGTVVHESRTGRQLHSYPGVGQGDVLALGSGVVVHTDGDRAGQLIARRGPEHPYEELLRGMPELTIGRTPTGFVVSFATNLWFGAARGPLWRKGSVGEPHLGARMMTSDPVSGRLVLRGGGSTAGTELVLLDAELAELARLQRDGYPDVAFCGPDRLLQWHWGVNKAIESWRREGTTLVRTARTDLDDTFMHPVPLPARNLVVVQRQPARLVWLDAGTLTEVDGPEGGPVDAWRVAFSQDGALAAVAPPTGGTEVYDLGLCQLTPLLSRPLSALTPTALKTVEAQAKRAATPPVTEAVELLRAGLAHRFGAEIALGSGTPVAGGVDDVALGGG